MSLLVFNAGSSTLKFSQFEADTLKSLTSGDVRWDANNRNEKKAVSSVVKSIGPSPPVSAVGHRVVHGGIKFQKSVLINKEIKKELATLNDIAPLHNPPALNVIEAAESAFPEVPHIAVFDTAYFSSIEPKRYIYPLPYEWFSEWGIRRFGFHGISHAYCGQRAAEILKRGLADLSLIICHLGSGCSATAIQKGKPVSTTMGFTPLEGLMMGTRSGSIDPGILFYLGKKKGVATDEMDAVLNNKSGLLGVSGISSDFRQIEKAAQAGHDRAKLALDIFSDRIRSAIGSLAVLMGQVDALIFTGGIGENAPTLRKVVCQGLECLSLSIDDEKNKGGQLDSDIAAHDSSGRILVLRTREEYAIAREVKNMIHEEPK